ncbi:MAG TPA: DUF4198 domain-containing protein [Aquificae bacterium]|nr:DUF4198 domain-containing protein [Aquificota bacterium]
MKKVLQNFFSFFLLLNTSYGHFIVLKPNKDIVENPSDKRLKIICKFTHPMQGYPNMDFEIEKFGVYVNGKEEKLNFKTRWIRAFPKSDKYVRMYLANYKIKKPGVYQFFVIPKPYWEAEEGKFIKQITKVYLQAFGLEEGWDKPIGLKAEIVPLTRPFGLWEGNTFKGRAFINGKPAKNVKVEIEYLNPNFKSIKLPASVFITQVVKTDENGYFEYTIPWAGWWGFSVIGKDGNITYKGHSGPVELDAVLWIRAYKKPKGVK